MRLSSSGYYVDFFVYPVLIVALVASALAHSATPLLLWTLLLFVFGVMAWTLIEYLLHRAIFHHVPIFVRMHELHHDKPTGLIGTPTGLSLAVGLFGVLAPLWGLAGLAASSGFTGGLALGYLWYIVVHHAAHHWRIKPDTYLYRAKRRHARHHYCRQSGNFGVTTSLWDRVFGTALEDRPRHGAGDVDPDGA